jgi:diguanylate cyclase (GGDEF)-like protein/PAS domain S-box-containing protein
LLRGDAYPRIGSGTGSWLGIGENNDISRPTPMKASGEAHDRRAQSESGLRELMYNVSDLIQSVAIDGTILYTNRGWHKVLGYAEGEISNLFQIIHPDSVSQCQALFQQVMQGETLEFVKAIFVAKDGQPVYLEGSANCTFKDGKPVATNSIFRNVTTRKEAERERLRVERALRQSEQRFRSLFNSTYQFMGLLSPDGTLLEANEPALLIAGLEASDVIGKPLWETHWFSHSAEARARVREAIVNAAQGEFVRYEVEIMAAGNRTIVIDFSLKPVVDDAGLVVQIIPEGRDITVKHELTQQLKASEQRLRTITDNIPAMIGYMDREKRYRFANKSAESWFPMSQEEVIGQPIEFLLGAEAYERAKPYIDQAMAGEMVSFENHRSDGRYANVTYVPDWHGDSVIGIYTFVTDITERYEAAKSLYMEKERARTTLGSIGDGVLTINADGRIDYLNPVTEKMTGWKLADAIGMRVETVLRLIDQSDGKSIESPLYHTLVTGESALLPPRTILISKDGSEYSVEDSCTPIRDSEGVITGAVLIFRDVTDKRKMVDRITFQARHDALTGLVNRLEFERVVEAQLQDTKTSGHQHALLFIDLDRFKLVNDTSGHKAGDELLRRLSKLMLHKLRKSDLLARVGGDEFGVLLENCRLEKAQDIAQSLIAAIGEFSFQWEEKLFTVGASIGVVPISRDAKNVEGLFAAADAACYWAKEHGRNQAKIYHEEEIDSHDRQVQDNWIERIKAGLSEDRFCLYGQRIGTTGQPRDNGADSFEVLVRLREGDQALVPPMAFLPAAERHNLMPQIDRWVIQHALSGIQQKNAGKNGGHFFINLSGTSLADEALPDFITEQFRVTEIAPQRICFEIAEVAAVAQIDEAHRLIKKLRSFGCRVALDNFVSGPSSFPDLKRHPVDYLKIDGRFAKAIDSDDLDFAMVDSINRMAHVLNIKTVAESVETLAALDAFERIGVDHVQGYAVHEPQPFAELLC